MMESVAGSHLCTWARGVRQPWLAILLGTKPARKTTKPRPAVGGEDPCGSTATTSGAAMWSATTTQQGKQGVLVINHEKDTRKKTKTMLKSDVLGQSRRLTTVQHIYDRHTKFFMRSCFACKYPPGRQSAAPSTGPKVGDWWSPPCDTRSQVLDEAGKSYWPCFKWSRGINTSECPSVECRRHLQQKASPYRTSKPGTNRCCLYTRDAPKRRKGLQDKRLPGV